MQRSFLILDTYYPAFIERLYQKHPNLKRLSYLDQCAALMSRRFGTFDAYSFYLRELGHQAEEIVPNSFQLQLAWTRENSADLMLAGSAASVIGRLGGWERAVAVRQVANLRPDVFLTQDLYWADAEFLREIRPHVGLVLGQVASRLPPNVDLSLYDLILTSFPHFVDRLRQLGVRTEYFQLGFDPRLLTEIPSTERTYPVTFVGGMTQEHTQSMKAIDELSSRMAIDVWGYGVEALPEDSPLRRSYHGEAWGVDMYSVLAASQITLNRHIGIAEEYANNMRLYEATGMGACLLTDAKSNLSQIFEPGEEVVTYSSSSDLIEQVNVLIENPDLREQIAHAGHRRTLSSHSYRHRMQELSEIVERL